MVVVLYIGVSIPIALDVWDVQVGPPQMEPVDRRFLIINQGIVGCIPTKVPLWEIPMGYNPQESLENTINTMGTQCHQEFQIPKMEVSWTNLIFGYFGGGKTPLHKPYPYSLYRWGFLHFGYLKFLVKLLFMFCSILWLEIHYQDLSGITQGNIGFKPPIGAGGSTNKHRMIQHNTSRVEHRWVVTSSPWFICCI